MIDKGNTEQEDYSRMVNGNTILLSLEGWIKFVEGFTRGLQTTEKVSSAAVLDCIGEIMEYMNVFRKQITFLFNHCEEVLEENEKLKEELTLLKNSLPDNLINLIEVKDTEDEL